MSSHWLQEAVQEQRRLDLATKWICLVQMAEEVTSSGKVKISRFRGWGTCDAFTQD